MVRQRFAKPLCVSSILTAASKIKINNMEQTEPNTPKKKAKKSTNQLTLAIIFATLLISGSLIFVGFKLTSLTEQRIGELVETTINKLIQEQSEQNQPIVEIDANEITPKISKADHIYGPEKAEITIIEYSDYRCPYCAKFHETGKQLVANYDDKVNWAFRHFPIPSHEYAFETAVASECIADLTKSPNNFWRFTDIIFQEKFGATAEDVKTIATTEFKLEGDEFDKCLESKKFQTKVQKQYESGRTNKVGSTPGIFVINNETQKGYHVRGALPLEQFNQIIDLLLETNE